jgi:hypothetical protein
LKINDLRKNASGLKVNPGTFLPLAKNFTSASTVRHGSSDAMRHQSIHRDATEKFSVRPFSGNAPVSVE